MHILPREVEELESVILGKMLLLLTIDPDAWTRIQTVLNRATQAGVIVSREEAEDIRQMTAAGG